MLLQEHKKLARAMMRARLVLGWESLWRLGWPVPAWASLFVGIAFLDLLPRLSPFWHGAALALFAAGLLVLLARLRHFRLADRASVQRRLERDSGLAHRPLAFLDDRPAAMGDTALDRGLWQIQRARILALLGRLRLNPPAPGLPARDPLGLRFAAILVLVIGAAAGRHDWTDRLDRALDPGFDGGASPPLLQVWITPPAYTGKSPIVLQPERDASGLKIPAGSKLLAELQGSDRDARLEIGDAKQNFTRLDPLSQKIESEITGGSALIVRLGRHRLARWPMRVIEDQPPEIAFAAPPAALTDAKLGLRIRARDDYGVEQIALRILRDGAETAEEIPLQGFGLGRKDIATDQALDLSAHPSSGLKVTLWPVARDGGGHETTGEPASMILPERVFQDPVARAIAAQRHLLIADPAHRGGPIEAIGDIAGRPELFGGDLVVFLQLDTARTRLIREAGPEALPSVLDMLWAAALRVEQGEVQDARDRVNRAAQALADALANGAPDSEIDRLSAALDAAMQRLVAGLARQGAGRESGRTPQPGDKIVTPEQLRALLKQADDLARAGARDQAAKKLQALRDLISGLSTGGGMGGQRLQEGQNGLKSLADKQGALLEHSYQRTQRGGDHAGVKADRQAQSALGQDLQKLMQSLPDSPALGKALDAIGRAAKALQDGDSERAAQAQSDALDKLEQGARELGGAMGGQGDGKDGPERDPLGRSLSDGQPDGGEAVKVPGPGDLGKSREILDELRRRAGETDRPPAERDYLRRLLDKLY